MECLLIKCVPGTVMDMEKKSGEQNLRLLPRDQYIGYFSNVIHHYVTHPLDTSHFYLSLCVKNSFLFKNYFVKSFLKPLRTQVFKPYSFILTLCFIEIVGLNGLLLVHEFTKYGEESSFSLCYYLRNSYRTPRFNPWVGRPPREGNGNPLQNSCLENPMDRGTWQATVHAVTKSRTSLSNT